MHRSVLTLLALLTLAAMSVSRSVATETPTPAAQTPTALVETRTSVVGYVTEDLDGNRVASPGDQGAQTLAELFRLSEGRVVSGTSLLTDETSGRFEFAEVPQGEYLLSVWWSPGFISLQGASPLRATQGHPHVLDLGITVKEGIATQLKYITTQVEGDHVLVRDAEEPSMTPFEELAILVKPKPEGLIPYPVRTGQGPLPVGRATVAPAALPSSGQGPGSSGSPFPTGLVVLGLIVFAPIAALMAGVSYATTRSPR